MKLWKSHISKTNDVKKLYGKVGDIVSGGPQRKTQAEAQRWSVQNQRRWRCDDLTGIEKSKSLENRHYKSTINWCKQYHS